MNELSFTFAVGCPVVIYEARRGIVCSFPGVGSGKDAMWLIRDDEYFGGRPSWVKEEHIRMMTPLDLPGDGVDPLAV